AHSGASHAKSQHPSANRSHEAATQPKSEPKDQKLQQKPEPREQQHREQHREQPEQPEQPQIHTGDEGSWHDFIPHFARQYASRRGGVQDSWDQVERDLAKRRASLRGALPKLQLLSAKVPADYDSAAAREASLRAVADIEEEESKAASAARDALQELHQTSAQAVINKASSWQTVQDLMAGSDLKDAHSTEEALQAKIQKLEHFINMSHRSAADFDATRAAELVDALQKASAKVEENAAQHERNAKQALREARRHALGQVRSFEEKARAAVKTWKFHGIQAVKAQKGADLPEHLYESHEDRMRDAVGDAEDKAEGVVEKLEDRIHEHYGKLEDQLGDASFNARGKVLRHKAERAEERLRELARTLGASAALKEAQAASRFAAEEKSWRASHAPQLLVATRQSANASVKSSSEDSEVMAAQAMEQQAANHFKNSLSSLRELSAEDIISKASNWRTLQDLAAASRPSGSDSWEEALESNTKKLEQFNNESRKSAADFDASHAAKLAEAVHRAAGHVEHDADEQRHNMKAAMKAARKNARQHVKTLEAEARAAAKSWKFHGRRAVKAQRSARVPEHVYERHEDRMRDAVGDAEDRAENAAERLEEKVTHHFERLEDQLGDASFNARGKVLRHKAERAEERLRELARTLGASAALKEAQAASRFAAEEKSWRASHAPQQLDMAAPGSHRRGLLIAFVSTISFVATMAFLQRRRPVKVHAPPLLG
ncbi:unnamed protein product, partial [Symbiodinium pilosum]